MTEELKIIMETLAALGEAGKAGFIWWLIVKHGLPYLLTFFGVCVGAFTIYKIAQVVNCNSGDTVILRQIAEHLGMVNPNTYYGGFDRAKVYEAVRKLKKEQS